MKVQKLLPFALMAIFAGACNHNPQATGDDIIMQQEKKDNAIEYQKDSISLNEVPVVKATSVDSTAAKKATDSVK